MHTINNGSRTILVLKVQELRENETLAAAKIALSKGDVVSIEGTDMSLHSEGGVIVLTAEGANHTIEQSAERVMESIAAHRTADRVLADLA